MIRDVNETQALNYEVELVIEHVNTYFPRFEAVGKKY
jgi:hypothetical protein